MVQDKSVRYAAMHSWAEECDPQSDERTLEAVSSCEQSEPATDTGRRRDEGEPTTMSRFCINRTLVRQWRCPWAVQVRNANPATIYEKPRRGTT